MQKPIKMKLENMNLMIVQTLFQTFGKVPEFLLQTSGIQIRLIG